jgi:hypothetical protein
MTDIYRMLVESPKRKRKFGRPRRRWRIILKWILRKDIGKMWTGLDKDRQR